MCSFACLNWLLLRVLVLFDIVLLPIVFGLIVCLVYGYCGVLFWVFAVCLILGVYLFV